MSCLCKTSFLCPYDLVSSMQYATNWKTNSLLRFLFDITKGWQLFFWRLTFSWFVFLLSLFFCLWPGEISMLIDWLVYCILRFLVLNVSADLLYSCYILAGSELYNGYDKHYISWETFMSYNSIANIEVFVFIFLGSINFHQFSLKLYPIVADTIWNTNGFIYLDFGVDSSYFF